MGLSTQRISIEDSIPYEEETDTVDFISDDDEVEFSDTFQDSYNESESSSVPNVRSDTSDIPLHSEQSPTTPNDSVFTFVSYVCSLAYHTVLNRMIFVLSM